MDKQDPSSEPARVVHGDADRVEREKPSSRARLSIALIGLVAIASMGCMCAFIFALVAI